MPLRGGPPPEFRQLGGNGATGAAPQVPGLLQMAQSAMDGGGWRCQRRRAAADGSIGGGGRRQSGQLRAAPRRRRTG